MMANVRMSGETNLGTSTDAANDNKILTQLEKGSSNGTLTWEKAGEDMPFEAEANVIFPHMLAYNMHRCYYVLYGRGWFFMSVQYNEDTTDVLITVNMLPSAGMNVKRLEYSEEFALKLLRIVDEEIFNFINRDMTDKMKEEFLNEEF